ncbi:putative glycosyltransferase (GT4) [Formosa agariphila KMM 3901]|uniref:Putative glycosyltransferase (GT4) n=1 Tax=Formosa agariphila (strain DSM 15362 / KCTC 12365 / LMG 23005 / KMM 3901 / M-2Alg 35-1) TaxID=1347342 RepID=T2KM78_FORAG|nr:glycosyltransferase [Formosa agariphila]CDF79997.1 putative glycosyltransferase (GT4) [Formosa agariphila KMM 3901]
MTVVHINIGLGGGGAEHIILELAEKGNKNGIKNIVISLSSINQIEHKFKKADIETHFLNINSISNLKSSLNQINNILKPLDQVVFHCHMFHGLMFGILYSLFHKKTPIVFTLHNTLVRLPYRRYLLYISKHLRKFDINFSKDGERWYLKPITVIANGVDFNKFVISKQRSYNVNEKFVFLFIGRIQEQKNPLFLVDLVTKLLKEGKSNFEIQVAGDGNLKGELEELVTLKNYDKYIKLLGFQNNVKQLLETSHCIIMPSLWEGLPVTLIEASTTLLPIITTPVGSIPEYFNDENSYVSELDSFHLHMIQVMEDYDGALIKAKVLYKDNKSIFDINEVYKKHEILYRECLQ